MKNTLAEIVLNKRSEIAQRKTLTDIEELREKAVLANGSFITANSSKSINIIAEVKPKSPSAGVLRASDELDIGAVVEAYSKYATAISVLTDEKYFGGSLSLLKQISERTSLPTLCKDFIVDPFQIHEARLCGAEAVLLIVKILTDEELVLLQGQIQSLGMKALVEIQNEVELSRALAASPEILLINNRNLDTFETDLATTERLALQIPETLPVVSASGIANASDISRLLPYTRRFLIGSSIMRSSNVEEKLRQLCEVGELCGS